MQLGDDVIHGGRVLVLRGLDPMSVPDGRADVEDPEMGERLSVPMSELTRPAPVVPGLGFPP